MNTHEAASDIAQLRLAAANGNPEAQYKLGLQLNKGEIVPKNDREAIGWLRRAAEQKHVAATALLASLNEYGEGAPRNKEEALRLYQQAAAAGSEFSKEKVAQLTRELKNPPGEIGQDFGAPTGNSADAADQNRYEQWLRSREHYRDSAPQSQGTAATADARGQSWQDMHAETAQQGSPVAPDLGQMVTAWNTISQDRPTMRFEDEVARLAVRAYVLALPLLGNENELLALISANRSYFLEGGKAIRYMQAAGNALLGGAVAYTGPSVQDMFRGMMPLGLDHLPGQVDADMRGAGFALGGEFLWLSQVLPAVALGNYGPYNTTGTAMRKQLITYVQMFAQMNPAMLQMVANVAAVKRGEVEGAVYNLVSQLNI